MLGCNTKKWKFIGFSANHEVVLRHSKGSKLLVSEVKLIDDESKCTFVVTGSQRMWYPTETTVRKTDASVISLVANKLFNSSLNSMVID